jgi:hypothetical protein
MSEENQFPSLPEQAKNSTLLIADVIRNAIQNNQIFANSQEKNRRMSLCMSCEHFDAPSKRCKKCGCYMESKTGFTAAKCPVGKW